MKPITYFADTAAIQSLCLNYGDRLENLSIPDRLALTKGLTEHLLHTAGYQQSYPLIQACKGDGHVFGDGMAQKQIHLEGLINTLGQELTPREAAQLTAGILQTVYPM